MAVSAPSDTSVGGVKHGGGFGFEIVAHAGPETGRRDRCSYLLQQGDIRFLVTGALTPCDSVAVGLNPNWIEFLRLPS